MRTTRPATSAGTAATLDTLTLAGTAATLRPGDRLLFVFGDADLQTGAQPVTTVRPVASATPDFTAGRTTVALVPSDLNGLQSMRDLLSGALDHVEEERPTSTAAQAVLDVVARGHAGIADGLDHDVVARLVSELAEADALVRARASAPVREWLDGAVAAAADLARQALLLVGAADRRSPPEIEFLRELAVELVCPAPVRRAGGPRTAPPIRPVPPRSRWSPRPRCCPRCAARPPDRRPHRPTPRACSPRSRTCSPRCSPWPTPAWRPSCARRSATRPSTCRRPRPPCWRCGWP